MVMQDKIFQLLFEQDDVTWQNILYDLVRKEQMDPWDINVSEIAQKYIQMVKTIQQMDFRISGKVLLAAAILLKIKSSRLVGDDMLEFDRLLYATEEIDQDQFYDELQEINKTSSQPDTPGLIPRTPQPRKRKVSIYDLVNALEQALEVKRRRIVRSIPPMQMEAPQKKIDVSMMIKRVYGRILDFFSKGSHVVLFTDLVPSDSRRDKVMTFIPLLHLSNQRKIDLWQRQHFGDIEVILTHSRLKKQIDREMGQDF
jgi:segregation and condensation protein A